MKKTTYDITKEYLEERGVFTGEIPEIVEVATNIISDDVPYRLKLSIVLSELSTFVSNLRKNIELYDGTIVPCNNITIALARSGVSKDTSLNKIRRLLKPAYDTLEAKRKEIAKQQAEHKALIETGSSENWLDFYTSPPELHVGLGTVEGIVKHFYQIEQLPLGAASLQASEIGTELQSNTTLTDVIKTIAIGYDIGHIPVKVIKNAEDKVGTIQHLPINLLMFGSEDAILYDNTLKEKFKVMFNSQLARRTLFSYSPDVAQEPDYDGDTKNILNYHRSQRKKSKEANEELVDYMIELVEFTDQETLKLSNEAQDLFDIYLEYNNSVYLRMERQFPITRLSRKHKQWLALKLSGVYAILSCNSLITKENYIQAINTIELLSDDLYNFENELTKEPYEQLSDYCQMMIGNSDSFYISIHELKKLGYISSTTKPETRLNELIYLISAYDKNGIYTRCDDGICYEPIITEEYYNVSAITFERGENESLKELKERMTKSCNEGYEAYEIAFSDIPELLQTYSAYTPFNFKDGKRSKANLYGKTKWIVLDVDDANITDEEAHFLLSDIRHHIARTSDPENPFKFRIVLDLDMQIDVPDSNWKYFLESISNDLGIKIDLLPKSQIYFSYGHDMILSNLDAEPYPIKDHVIKASQHVKPSEPTKLPKKQKEEALNDPRETFKYAFEAEMGEGSRSLIRAAYHARDLGANKEYIIDLMHMINNYWSIPMDKDKLEKTIISQIHRFKD
jgi:hypothetical protein